MIKSSFTTILYSSDFKTLLTCQSFKKDNLYFPLTYLPFVSFTFETKKTRTQIQHRVQNPTLPPIFSAPPLYWVLLDHPSGGLHYPTLKLRAFIGPVGNPVPSHKFSLISCCQHMTGYIFCAACTYDHLAALVSAPNCTRK